MQAVKKSINILSVTIIVVAAVTGLTTIYTFVKNNIWRPKIKVITVDYSRGTATIEINGKVKTISSGSTTWAGGDWGVRFGGNRMPADGSVYYDRIELIKGELVYNVVAQSNL